MHAGLAQLAAAAAPIAYGEGPSVPWARIVLSLLFCIALAFGAVAFVRWRSGQAGPGSLASLLRRVERGTARRLELLERLPLTPTTQLCLVRSGNSRLLVLVSPGGAQLIERLDEMPDEDGKP